MWTLNIFCSHIRLQSENPFNFHFTRSFRHVFFKQNPETIQSPNTRMRIFITSYSFWVDHCQVYRIFPFWIVAGVFFLSPITYVCIVCRLNYELKLYFFFYLNHFTDFPSNQNQNIECLFELSDKLQLNV